MRIYKIIFFYIYRSLLKSNLKDTPVYFATLIFSGLQGCNIMTLVKVIERLLDTKITPDQTGTFELIVFFTLVLIPNLVYIYTKKKYKEIIEEFEQVDEKNWKRRRLLVLLYAILSFVFLYASVLFK